MSRETPCRMGYRVRWPQPGQGPSVYAYLQNFGYVKRNKTTDALAIDREASLRTPPYLDFALG